MKNGQIIKAWHKGLDDDAEYQFDDEMLSDIMDEAREDTILKILGLPLLKKANYDNAKWYRQLEKELKKLMTEVKT